MITQPANWEFQVIETLQKIRCPVIDDFFITLNFFDSPAFYFMLIPFLWLGYNWRVGVKVFFIFILSNIVNELLKDYFMALRPFEINPMFYVIKVSGFSFPSGAAQSSVIMPVILISTFKNKKWPWIVGINFFFWISLSRMYLGVHFPRDILFGWFIGVIVALVYLYIFPIIENMIRRVKSINAYIVSQVFLLSCLFIPQSKISLMYIFGSLGVTLGLLLCSKYHLFLKIPKNFKEFFVRVFLCLLGIFFISYIFLILPLFQNYYYVKIAIAFYISGAWLSFLSAYSYKRFFSKP